jgi:wyosine [tRNA(Phe)-imidazoG37] synthetase (radical SAM superfamily)
VYCERGRTFFGCRDYGDFTSRVEMEIFMSTLKRRIKTKAGFECLTFSGTGEPTLEPRLGEFITSARKIIGNIKIKVITNSTLLTHSEVIKSLTEVDEVIAKLNAVSEDVFAEIHRPFDENLNPRRIVRGLYILKSEIESKVTIEVLFIRSHKTLKMNNNYEEVEELTRVLRELEPSKIHIHTIRRFPAEPYILEVKERFLNKVEKYMKRKLPKTKVSMYV